MQRRKPTEPVAEEIRAALAVPGPVPGDPSDNQVRPTTQAHDNEIAPPRLRVPDRRLPLSAETIDDLIEADHPARAVWAYVEDLDLKPWYDRIRARGSVAGRSAIDPRLLVALWLYATLGGFSSARALADLVRHHDAFRWLAGGVPVNYHTLADFRTDHPDDLEGLLKQSVERLRRDGLVDLDRIAQDGIRVRASAGAASFRRQQTLERLLSEARDEIRRLKERLQAPPADPDTVPQRPRQGDRPQGDASEEEEATQADPGPAVEPSPRRQAARLRHARERVGRLEAALGRLPEMASKIPAGSPRQARVSSTDPWASVMKMADGGFRPAYNLQFATTCAGQVIVGVDVTTSGSDQGQLLPMVDQIKKRFGRGPKEALVDGGFVNGEDITALQGGDPPCLVYAPVPKPKKAGVDRYAAKKGDGAEVSEWRGRMGTESAREVYKQRGATAECVNAQCRNRGLQRLPVRGTPKVKAIGLWFAITHNMRRLFAGRGKPTERPDSTATQS